MAHKKKIEVGIKSKISSLKAKLDEDTNHLDFEIRQITRNIDEFTRAHMSEIRQNGKMSMELNTGIIKTKEVEDFDYGDEDEVIAGIIDLGYDKDLLAVEYKLLKSVIKAKAKKESGLLQELGISVHKEVKITIKPY